VFGISALQLAVSWQELVLRSAVIFVVLMLALRLFGKREVGQFTLFDLVFVLLVANAVQPAMTGPDTSVTGGLIIIVTLTVLNWIIGRLREDVPWTRRLLGGSPRVIARDGAWDQAAMRREGLDQEDCEMTLREHGLADVSQVSLAVLETDGNISVVPVDASGTGRPRNRRVRFLRH